MRDDLDREIDAVVSAMLDVDSREDLRARVLERIAQPGRWSPLRWAIMPIAAIALLALVIAGPWWTGGRASAIRSTSIAQAVPAVDAALSRAVPRLAGETTRTVASVKATTRPLSLASNEPATAVEVAPLARLDAIDVAPVAIRSLNHQQIAVEPLAPLAQIDVEPVGPPQGRN